ncbi:MAG: hypothetical protein AB7E52_03400 [Bdellovibrionales bacterium]
MTDIGPVAQQGVLSTQVERVQNDRPTAVEPPREVVTTPPETATPTPPPAETGRGATVDTSA